MENTQNSALGRNKKKNFLKKLKKMEHQSYNGVYEGIGWSTYLETSKKSF